MDHLTGQLVYGLELVGKDAVTVAVKIIGALDPKQAEPGTIRALYGIDPVRNCVHVSMNAQAAAEVSYTHYIDCHNRTKWPVNKRFSIDVYFCLLVWLKIIFNYRIQWNLSMT